MLAAAMTKYRGTYRATVLNNVDPRYEGRLFVVIPDAGVFRGVWALPASPWRQAGDTIFAPAIGASVWIEFEDGELTRPIWTVRAMRSRFAEGRAARRKSRTAP